MSDIFNGPPKLGDSDNTILLKIWSRLQALVGLGGGGGGGGGGGDASAANQAIQIAQETATNTVLGLASDAAATAGSAGTLSAKFRLITTQLASLISNTAGTVLGASSAIIGKVRTDLTTPGTTNLVSIGTDGTVSVTGVSTAGRQDTGNGYLNTLTGVDFSTASKQDALLAAITKVGSTPVVGITESDGYVTGANANHTISAGTMAIALNFSSDFVGTVQGATYTAAAQGIALSRVAQPGNLLPAMAITVSAGTFDYYIATP